MNQSNSPQLYLSGIKNYFQNLKPIWIILLITILLVLVELFFNFLFNILGISYNGNYLPIPSEQPIDSVVHFIQRFLVISIFAPLAETFIFQHLLFKLFIQQFKFRTASFIIIGGIIFGLSHMHSITSIIVITTMGFILNYFYQLLREKNSEKTAYIVIAAAHSNLNTCIIITNIIGLIYY